LDDRTAVLPAPEQADDGEMPTIVQSIGGAPDDDATIVRPRTRGRPRLVLRDADGRQREVALVDPDISIGRSSTCGVALANPEVSRVHARITARGEDHALVPVGTRHNTYVNGEATTSERLLRHGDVIQLAGERLVYAEQDELPSEPAGATAPSQRWIFMALATGILIAVAVLAWSLRAGRSVPSQGDTVAAVPTTGAVVAPPPAPPASLAGNTTAEQKPAPIAAQPAEQPAGQIAGVEHAGPPSGAPAGATAPDARAEQIAKLRYQADIAFLEKKYTTPPDGSAVFLYGQLLKLDPANERARDQLLAIVNEYLTWAENDLQRDRARARLYADKAGYVYEQLPGGADAAGVERRLQALARVLGGRAPALGD
jgi:hypothetical protein